jgi:hypothetical protein
MTWIKKYQCNTCGRIYDDKKDAAMCHPDITEIDIEEKRTDKEQEQNMDHDTYDKPLTEWQAFVLETIREHPRLTAYDYAVASEGRDNEVYDAIGFLLANQRVKMDLRTAALTVWGE